MEIEKIKIDLGKLSNLSTYKWDKELNNLDELIKFLEKNNAELVGYESENDY